MENIIDHAQAFCTEHKERLTKPRVEVLKIISQSLKPVGAYEILEKLGQVIHMPKPPTVYRAIEFWLQNGFIHRIESLNAYTTCHAGHKHKGSQFMICDECGIVIEVHICEMPNTLQKMVTKNTFLPSNWNLEIHGLCQECQSP
ncbi:MAG: Fur family transcriptional regulator [Chlamydiota bacterium]|nr:Fur family transcriptional regulator [Chlamydiota bacterium]